MSGRPPMITWHGYEAGEIVSWLQKSIRRGLADEAVYCAAELERSGYAEWCWKRLMVIASEDVGIANRTIATEICSLYSIYQLQVKKDAEPRLMLIHAVLLLCESAKSSTVVNAVVWGFSGIDYEPRREVPDYVYDRHTVKGKRLGRGYKHFVEEGSMLVEEAENRWSVFFKNKWKAIFLSRDKDGPSLGPELNPMSPRSNGPIMKKMTKASLFTEEDEPGNDRFTQ